MSFLNVPQQPTSPHTPTTKHEERSAPNAPARAKHGPTRDLRVIEFKLPTLDEHFVETMQTAAELNQLLQEEQAIKQRDDRFFRGLSVDPFEVYLRAFENVYDVMFCHTTGYVYVSTKHLTNHDVMKTALRSEVRAMKTPWVRSPMPSDFIIIDPPNATNEPMAAMAPRILKQATIGSLHDIEQETKSLSINNTQ